MHHTLDHRDKMHDGRDWLTGMETMGLAAIKGTLLYSVPEGERFYYGNGCGPPPSFESQFGFKPSSCARGYHHDLYHPYLYLYKASDLERVRNGEIEPSNVYPYEYVSLEPNVPVQANLLEMDTDNIGHRLFIAQRIGDAGVRIHVYGWSGVGRRRNAP